MGRQHEPILKVTGGPSPAARQQPRTVLYVHHRPELGGAPTSLFHLLCGLDRDRYRPVMLCPRGAAAALFASAGVPVYKGPISTFTHVVTSTYHGLRWGMLARELARAIPHAWAVAHLVRHERVSLVHLNEGNLLLAALVARLCGARVVCHFRGMLADGNVGIRRRLVRAWLARWTDAVIAIDGSVATPLAGIPQLKIIHNSVDLDAFSPSAADGGGALRAAARRELQFPADAVVAGMVGRVRADEGSLDFLRAAARLMYGKQSSSAGLRDSSERADHFLLVGGGTRPPEFFRTTRGRLLLASGIIRDELADAQKLVSELRLTNVQFVPFRRDVAAIYAALDVVVTGGEAGIGRQALEAAAAGRPIVAAARRPVPDLVVDGETGFLVPPGDVEALADCLGLLLASPDVREKVGKAARILAEERFQPGRNAERVMAIYDELLCNSDAQQ
jgi:glycosyltransferase involved in cell wall biosynthesis